MYGHVCSTNNAYVAIPSQAADSCDQPYFKQESSTVASGTRTSDYKMTISKSGTFGGSVIFLLTFSQPVTPAMVTITGSVCADEFFCKNLVLHYVRISAFQYVVKLNQSLSNTSLIVETQLATTASDNFFSMKVVSPSADPEPCLIHSTCNYCETGKCDDHRSSYTTNGTSLQEINKYKSSLEYFCGLGMEFRYGGATKTSHKMICEWDGKWYPTGTLDTCICEREYVFIISCLFVPTIKVTFKGLPASTLPTLRTTPTW